MGTREGVRGATREKLQTRERLQSRGKSHDSHMTLLLFVMSCSQDDYY